MRFRNNLLFSLLAVACKTQSPSPEAVAQAPATNAPEVSVAPPATSAPEAPSAVPQAAAASAAASAQPAAAEVPVPTDLAAAPASAKRTASGLATRVLQPGKGKEHPGVLDKVKVNYSGWTKDGKMFDSSIPRHSPTSFGVTQVIPGWTEGLQLMVAGEKRRMWIPAKLAYGEHPMAGAPAGDLVFDVELLEISKPPKAPPDVKAPPANVTKTKSGMSYRVLQKGTGKDHPTATSRVTVHYSGWSTDGKMFDSSVARGEPSSFSLNQVIKGWTEGVQLMVVGEKTRFWIPADLAYGNNPRPGAPSGMLVFDIELLNIQ
jgi:peptidylprolyl isomerase